MRKSFGSREPQRRGERGGARGDKKRGPREERGYGPKRAGFIFKKRKCRFCADKNIIINYLDHQMLRKFTTERGKIVPSRISGTCARHQRKLTNAIKKARNIALLPFVGE